MDAMYQPTGTERERKGITLNLRAGVLYSWSIQGPTTTNRKDLQGQSPFFGAVFKAVKHLGVVEGTTTTPRRIMRWTSFRTKGRCSGGNLFALSKVLELRGMGKCNTMYSFRNPPLDLVGKKEDLTKVQAPEVRSREGRCSGSGSG